MRIMHCMMVLLTSCVICIAAPLLSFQITVPETGWTDSDFSNKCEAAWVILTGSTDYENLWAGWATDYCLSTNTNTTIYLYRNSIKNILGENVLEEGSRTQVVNKVTEYTNSHSGINTTPAFDLTTWGIQHKVHTNITPMP